MTDEDGTMTDAGDGPTGRDYLDRFTDHGVPPRRRPDRPASRWRRDRDGPGGA